jgi:hypothetical protein
MMAIPETMKDWLSTFWRVLASPTPKTFAEEAEKAKNKFSSAIGWAVFTAAYSYLVPALFGQAFDLVFLVIAILIFPIAIVLVPSATHFMLQHAFRRKQYLYDKALYIYTAIFVLFQIIIIPITYLVPSNIVSFVDYIFIAYQFVLFVMAVKAIAKIKYWQAIVTVLVSAIIGALIFICSLPVITSLMSGVSSTLR